RAKMRELILTHPMTFYFGAIGIAFVAAVAALVSPLFAGERVPTLLPWLLLAALAVLLPAADAAIAVVHQLVNVLVPAERLPRLDYDEGVPHAHRTLVVVPLLLGSVDAVTRALEHVEVQFLANRDAQI